MQFNLNSFACAFAVCVTGCAAADMDDDRPSTSAGPEILEQNLQLGSQGPAVRAVHDYLTTYGYFPNQELAQNYPAWRPIVATPPSRAEVYDSQTERAVRELQRNSGLPQTGVVDAATRELLAMPRCGVPDGEEPLDPDQKFALGDSKQEAGLVTWWLNNTTTGVTRAQGETAVQQALSQWELPTAHSFMKLDSVLNAIRIRFSATKPNGDPWGNTLGAAFMPADGGDVWINSRVPWSTASSTPSDKYDLNSLLLHELGHALGLKHSSIRGAVMKSGLGMGSQKSLLHADDIAAGLARRIGWEKFDSAKNVDVAFFTHARGADLFVVGGEKVLGGYQIWDLQNGSWVLMPGAAVRIAAQAGQPWMVNELGSIYRWNGSAWTLMPGCATDIGMGGDGSVWITGCTAVPGGREIRKWNGVNAWTTVPGGAMRISVGPAGVDKTENVPWVVNLAGEIFRRTSSNPAAGDWETLPGLATDIAVSGRGTAWILGRTATSGGFSVYIWNEQPAGDGSPPAPRKRGWIATGGAGLAIAADDVGFPYIVNDSGAFWTR